MTRKAQRHESHVKSKNGKSKKQKGAERHVHVNKYPSLSPRFAEDPDYLDRLCEGARAERDAISKPVPFVPLSRRNYGFTHLLDYDL